MGDPVRDFAQALEDFAEAVTEALHVPAMLDWLGRFLERCRLRVW